MSRPTSKSRFKGRPRPASKSASPRGRAPKPFFLDKDKLPKPCIHQNECGGCPIIRLPYGEQLERKRQRVFDAYLKAGFSEPIVKQAIKSTKASPLTLGYRNKAKWVLDRDASGLKMGIYAPGTHDVVDIPKCAVHAPLINEFSAFVKAKLEAFKVPCGPLNARTPTVRYLIVRYSFREKKLVAVFVTSAHKIASLEKVFAAIDREWADRVVAVVQNINDDTGNVLLGEANRYQAKRGELSETFGGFRVPVGPLSFLQVNSGQASYLYRRTSELLGPGPFKAGLDLYSGAGLFAFHMADRTESVLAVEEVGAAALEGITAARRNKISNVLHLCADSLEGIQTFCSEFGTPDWVVLNPPRKGCEEPVLRALLERFPKKLVYISCNPNTQARDIRILLKGAPHLKLRAIEPVDMFPQTDHVECIVYLENPNAAGVKPAAGASLLREPAEDEPIH